MQHEGVGDISIEPNRELILGRRAGVDIRLKQVSVSAKHSRLKLTIDGLEIIDLDSRFGVKINGVRIKAGVAADGDIIQFGEYPAFRFDGTTLRIASGHGESIRIESVKISRGGKLLVDFDKLTVDAGAFVGIIGPSGAGKSLLLGSITGVERVDSGVVQIDRSKGQIANVPQDDVLYRNLSVEENILFQAKLRTSDSSPINLEKSVSRVIDAVDLSDHRKKRVSVLSGGQRKRVSVAIELLTRPQILILDEPTSGVDPGTESQLIDLFRLLSRQGMTVLCTTHSMETLAYFDSVIALGLRGGKIGTIAFQGSRDDLLKHFEVNSSVGLFRKLSSLPEISDLGSVVSSRVATALPESEQESDSASNATTQEKTSPPNEVFGRQAQIVLERSLLLFWRDRTNCSLAVAMPVLLACLVVFSQLDRQQYICTSFFLCIAAMWIGMTLTVRGLVSDRANYTRERRAGLDRHEYLAGRMIANTLLLSVQVILLLVSALIFAVLFIQADFVSRSLLFSVKCTFLLCVYLMISAFVGSVIGMTASAVASSEESAVSSLPLLIMPQMLISRVAYGSVQPSWLKSSPYASLPAAILDPDSRGISLLVSSLIVSRPITAANHAFIASEVTWTGVIVEHLHLAVLFSIHLVLLYVCFQRYDRLCSVGQSRTDIV